MDRRSPITNLIGTMMAGNVSANPRGPQSAFAVPTFLAAIVLTASGTSTGGALFAAGVALAALATVGAWTLPWSRLPGTAVMALPLVDLAAIAFFRVSSDVAVTMGVLMVFPAMWMGMVFRLRGVVVITLASLVTVLIPALAGDDSDVQDWIRVLLLPVVVLVVANSLRVTSEVWTDQRKTLVSEGKQSAHALAESQSSQDLLEAVINTVPVGIVVVDEHGERLRSNDTMAAIDELIADASSPDGTAHVYERDRTTRVADEERAGIRASRGESITALTRWIGKDHASQRALSISARPMQDARGDTRGAVLAYQDVTDLLHALRVRDEFVASVSHEFRTPLTSILGYIEMIGDHADEIPDQVNSQLAIVSRNAERLLALVSDLLATSLVEGGEIAVSRSSVRLIDVVRRSIDSALPRARAQNLTIQSSLDDVPVAFVDAGRMGQVTDNLLSNAIKYTPSGGSITVSLTGDAGTIKLGVTDTGIGISPDDQKNLFTKFFRAHRVQSRAIAGVGLGLVITKAIVTAHGGDIVVRSTENVGTTVTVTLPVGATT